MTELARPSSLHVFKNQADKQGSCKLKVELSICTDFELAAVSDGHVQTIGLSGLIQPSRRDAPTAAGETPTLLKASEGVRSSRPRALGRPRPSAVMAEVESRSTLMPCSP